MNPAIPQEATRLALLDSAAEILIVDDTPAKRLAMESVLAPLGHGMISVDSGEAALRQVMSQTFAVIMLDVQMPGMDGYETAQLIRLRAESEHTPIIFVTSHLVEETQIPVGYRSGAVDFIFAPIVPDVMRAKTSVFIELYRKSQQLKESLDEVTKLNDQVRESDARNRAIVAHVADGILTVNGEGTIETFNRAATNLFGYSEEEAVGQPFAMMLAHSHVAGEEVNDLIAQYSAAKNQGGNGANESIGRRSDGTTFPMELDLSAVEVGERKLHIACIRNISEREAYDAKLQHQALHDDLTDLPNRVLFGDRLDRAVSASKREGTPRVLMVLDLDGFKEINDSLGHEHGDLLLKAVADRLASTMRDGDTVARLGGDEFGIVAGGAMDVAGAASLAWKLERTLAEPFQIKGHVVTTKASIGMALVPNHGTNTDDLLRRADLAMYDAKRSGNGCAMFSAEHEELPARRLELLRDLRVCVERDELVLHYQPKIDLKTGRTMGVEALIRWNHPSGEMLQPGAFMPEVETNELILPITEWVIGEALGQLDRWRTEGFDLTMAVNIGARCLANGTGVFDRAEFVRDQYNIPKECLTFELTEQALLETDIPGLTARLDAMGEQLSIDDFGTGHSSLVYLQQLPVVEIKADRSFVSSLATESNDAIIVNAIIDLAHNLGLRVVAEGVEDDATLRHLVGAGCDIAQGFHFSKPMPAKDLTRWFDESAHGIERDLSHIAFAHSA